jgi:hypothetical protein
MKRFFCALMAFVLAFPAAFGTYAADRYRVEPTHIVLYTSLPTVRVGQTREISYELYWPGFKYYMDQNEDITLEEFNRFAYVTGTGSNLRARVKIERAEWSSSDPDIAEISEYGELTAKAPGVVTITLAVRGPNSEGKIVELASEDIEITVTEKLAIDDLDRYLPQREQKPAPTPEKNYANGEITSKELTALVAEAAKTTKAAKVTVRNAASVPAKALQAAAKVAADFGAKATINFDTMNGGSVSGRVMLDPAIAAEMTGDIKLGVTSTGDAIEAAAKKVKIVYKNRVVVVKAEQAAWGGAVRYAVKSGLNYVRARDLKLYSLNPDTGKCAAITGDANFATDINGYVRFSTAKGGWLVLSDGELDEWDYGTN